MSWTKKTLFISIGLLLAFLPGLLVMEMVFGNWILQDPWLAARELNIIRDQQVTYNVHNVYGHRTSTTRYTRDIYGLRGGCQDPADIQILTMGGSTTDQRLVTDGETWQDILAQQIHSRLQRAVCVSNAGVDGHSTFGHIASFSRWFPLIKTLRPQYYLFYIGVNDAGLRMAPLEGLDTFNPNDTSLPPRSIFENSAVYQLLRLTRTLSAFTERAPIAAYAGHARRPPQTADYTATQPTEGVDALVEENTRLFEQRLRVLLAEVNKRSATAICVSQPHLFVHTQNELRRGVAVAFEYNNTTYNGLDYAKSIDRLNQAMRDTCLRLGAHYIDIASKEFSVDDFYDLVHNTPQGANRLGRYMFEEFERIGILTTF